MLLNMLQRQRHWVSIATTEVSTMQSTYFLYVIENEISFYLIKEEVTN